MGEVVVQRLNELNQLDPGVHWFCPRSHADDSGLYFDEDVLSILETESTTDKAIRLKKVEEAEQRRDAVLEGCKVFAFDGSDAKVFQDQLKEGLNTQLTRCDICVREYHRARTLLVQRLEAQFEIDEVQLFMEKFDAINIERIASGLNKLTEGLLDLAPDQRNVHATGDTGMYALFEALHCVPLLKNEDALQKYFNRPFRLLQSKRSLKLPSYVPGMTAFIFSNVEERSSWAVKNFSRIKRTLTRAEFEHSVKSFLEAALARVNIFSLEKEFLPDFWRGTKLIASKLTKDLVTNNLRALDGNLYTTGLEHFQIDDTHFLDLLATYQTLLELNPDDFWDAMGSISAQSVVETVFRSAGLQNMLKTTQEKAPLHLEERMDWTTQVVKSMKPANLVPPLKIILDQLLHSIQNDQFSRYARSVCWQKGFTCLLTSLKIMRGHVRSGPTITHMIQIVATDHITLIMNELDKIELKTEMQIDKTEQLCLDIVEHALALDTTALVQDRHMIIKTKDLDHELGLSGLNVWSMSIGHVKPGSPLLATSILCGIRDLIQLEPFPPRYIASAPKQAEGWNDALKRVHKYVSKLLNSLDGFDPDQLDELFLLPNAAQGLIYLLFNGEGPIHSAALDVLKALSGQDGRRGSIMHMLGAFFHTAMPSINAALEKLFRHRIFSPCSISLKICTDVFNSLCDSQDGILRSKKLPQDSLRMMETFWKKTWQFLGMIFEQTEPWSNLGYDKQMMQDFCRETMDFADYAFDQYSIIASTLQAASKTPGKEVRKTLLESPKSTFMHICKWLRLRDDYLIAKAVSLTSKILGRLQEVGIEIERDDAQYIENVVTSTEKNAKVKTRLSMAQKAELQSALEKHLNLAEIIDVEVLERPKKQVTLQDWASSGRSSGQSTPMSATGKASKPGTIDVDAWSDAAKRKNEFRAAEKEGMKSLMNSMEGVETYNQKMLQQQKKPSVPSATSKSLQKVQEDQKNFLLRRQKEKEEAEKRKAAALAQAKGLGAGSGVSGLGDIGKDHSMKGQNVMVSSDEESEDDEDDDMDADLFGPVKRKIERPNVDPNGAIGLKPEQKSGPTRIHRAARSLKDQRARLAPDLTPLHRTMLQWDFFHDGDYPQNTNEHEFRQVSNSFNDPTTYQHTFQPLLTLEAWQGLVKAREELSSKPYEVKIQNRTNVDAFIEISSLIGHNENREIQIHEGDIVLFSKAKNPTTDSKAPHCFGRVYRVKRQKAHLEVVYQVSLNSSLTASLAQQAIVWGVKVQSIIPLEREYGALQALQYYDLCNQIIQAKPSKRLGFNEKQAATHQDVWNVNRAQSEAINAALENEGFSLIQGPPGSGKTKTIIAIIGGLLTTALSNPSISTGAKISIPRASANVNNGVDSPSKKLLVCAPSNAAVDELVMRLKEGVKTKGGRHHHINIVRIGRSEAINQQVLDVTMDELVAKRIGNNNNDQKIREGHAELFREHEKVSNILKELHAKKESGQLAGQELSDLESELTSVRKKKRDLGARIDSAKDAERNAGREAELNRKKAQQAVLDEAHVICATLSGSGHDMFQSLNVDLETVIIDEAAQCVEMSSLIPLKYGCIKCIMVGDPKQLPPTVFSKEAAKFQYEQSLFVRMQNNFPDEVYLLDTQYRMHPQISLFPSLAFYDSLLKDGQGMASLRDRPWHKSALLAPYKFFDVAGQHQAAPKGHSLVNLAEIEIAMALYHRLTSDFPNYDWTAKIGVITPYKSQLTALKNRFQGRFGNEVFDKVEFNTTDAFQGRESEVIIFSCVRASPAGGIGFLQDIRRMNVGLTRAKSSLWVLGNSESLIRGKFWKQLVEDAKSRDCYTAGDLNTMLDNSSLSFPATRTTSSSALDGTEEGSQVQSSEPKKREWQRSVEEVSEQSHANQRLFGTNATDLPRDADRMEGIRYRFEDRVSKNVAPVSDTGSRQSTPCASSDKISEAAEPEDVEMANAEDSVSNTATSSNTVSRAETPLSGEERRMNRANGSVKPGLVAPNLAHSLKKRPAASPFMPRKQAKPRPQ